MGVCAGVVGSNGADRNKTLRVDIVEMAHRSRCTICRCCRLHACLPDPLRFHHPLRLVRHAIIPLKLNG